MGGELGESGGGTGLLGTDLGDGGSREGLNLSTGLLGLLLHACSVGVDTGVGLLDGLGSLSLEGEAGTCISGHGVTDHAGHRLCVGGDAGSKGLASEGRLGMGLSGTLLEGLHLVDAVTDGNLKVTLGDISSRADGIEHLLLHLRASASTEAFVSSRSLEISVLSLLLINQRVSLSILAPRFSTSWARFSPLAMA